MSPSLPMVGEDFAGYRLRGVLGRGGMSVVFEAENPRLGSVVALKVLAPELAADDLFRARFLQESRIAASLNHPHVIPIYDTGPCDGLLYIAMRYVAGRDLRGVLKERERIPPEHALMLIAQAGRALDAAHRRGLVHRDVKPANILIERVAEDEPEHVYLADFGITKQARSQSGLTATGQFVGTIDYIAPEQIQGKSVDGRADIYSLGCVLYECITGRVPFLKDLDAAVIWAHVEELPTAPSAIRPELPPEIDEVMAHVLAKDPDERYSTAHEFLDAARGAFGIAPRASGAMSFDESAPLVSPTVLSGATAPPSQPPAQVSDTPPEFGEPQAAPPTVMPPAAASSPAATSPPLQPPADPPAATPPPATPPPASPPPAAPPPLAAAADTGGLGAASGPPSGGPPAGERPSRRWGPLAGAALLVVVVAGVVVALVSSGGGKSSGGSASTVAQGEATAARLAAVPTNHVNGSGTATVALKGDVATVTVNAQGLLNGQPHLMHIHAGGRGTCPPASAARLYNGHLAISTENGIPYYGPPEASLTTTGDTSAASYLVFGRFPTSGVIAYKRQIQLSPHLAEKIRANNAVVVIHGIDYDGSGIYDNVLSHSELLPTVPADATAPALCGTLVGQASAKASTSAGSAGGRVYAAALGAAPEYLAWWCEPPAAGTTVVGDARLDATGTREDA